MLDDIKRKIHQTFGCEPEPMIERNDDGSVWLANLQTHCDWALRNQHTLGYRLTNTWPRTIKHYLSGRVLSDVYHYFKNRFVTRTHLLDTGLTPGRWVDLDQRILYAVMNSFVNYITEEKGWMNYGWSYDGTEFDYAGLSFTEKLAHGIEHLHKEMEYTEESPQQAASAKEQHEILIWWLYEYPTYEELIWEPSYDNDAYIKSEEKTTEMLCRLMKIRTSLWT